jgi:hypothetical protein
LCTGRSGRRRPTVGKRPEFAGSDLAAQFCQRLGENRLAVGVAAALALALAACSGQGGRQVAESGVEGISVGGLTQSAPSLELSLLVTL